MSILPELQWRGLIADTNLASATPATVYAGFDPTAESLHVGHLMALTMLRRFQQAGWRAIAVIGGATGMVGDPSGKNEERNLLDLDTLRKNVTSIKTQIEQLLNIEIANNYEWMRDFHYLDFLRDVGKHFPVNVMLTKDSVQNRMESGLSYTEFSYMLIQAYDFVYLNHWHNCTLQIGGSDQWGNITAGIDLARRMEGAQVYGLTCPLLTKNDGAKMGKTESGTAWLSAKKTSPYDFYQFWLNSADADVGRFLKYLTNLTQSEIESVMVEHSSNPSRRIAQRRLADTLTQFVHGSESC